MIYDTLDRLANYRGLSGHLDAALSYLAAAELAGRPADGIRRPVAGDDVQLAVASYETRAPEAYFWENHRGHLDVQILLSGREKIAVAIEPSEPGHPAIAPRDEYDADRDVRFWRVDPETPVTELVMTPGVFAIFGPRDLHGPNRSLSGRPEPVTKAVLKVRVAGEAGW